MTRERRREHGAEAAIETARHAAAMFGLSLEAPCVRERIAFGPDHPAVRAVLHAAIRSRGTPGSPGTTGTPGSRASSGAGAGVRGGVVLIVGPSGAGKSTLLRAVSSLLRIHGVRVVRPAVGAGSAPAVELAARALGRDARRVAPEERALAGMRLLARVGLAEAACFVHTPERLSEGQRQRLALGLALARAGRGGRGGVVIADEFLAGLDLVTASSAVCGVARACARAGVMLLTATANEALARVVARVADAVIEVRAGGVAEVSSVGTRRCAARAGAGAGRGSASADAVARARVRVCRGVYADYRALSAGHYRAGRPAAPVLVLRAELIGVPGVPGIPGVVGGGGRAVGALVVTMPTLNGAWRRWFWPGRYTAGGKREGVRRLNREVRRIARVVVDPRCRGMGVAAALVRAYLRAPLTTHTEAAASMGAVCGFFEAAGMRALRLPPCPADARLLDAMACARLGRADAATPARTLALFRRRAGRAFVEREVRRWARSRRAPRRLAGEEVETLFALACAGISSPITAYAAERRSRRHVHSRRRSGLATSGGSGGEQSGRGRCPDADADAG